MNFILFLVYSLYYPQNKKEGNGDDSSQNHVSNLYPFVDTMYVCL